MGKITAKELTDSGICPTCYDRSHNHCVFGDNSRMIIYRDNLVECFLCGNPRCAGHTIISSVKHYKDMSEAPITLTHHMMSIAKRTMLAIRSVYRCSSVYLCTMCDGPMNHYHLQLIPRYPDEERGSRNFVKERIPYIHDARKVSGLRTILGYKK